MERLVSPTGRGRIYNYARTCPCKFLGKCTTPGKPGTKNQKESGPKFPCLGHLGTLSFFQTSGGRPAPGRMAGAERRRRTSKPASSGSTGHRAFLTPPAGLAFASTAPLKRKASGAGRFLSQVSLRIGFFSAIATLFQLEPWGQTGNASQKEQEAVSWSFPAAPSTDVLGSAPDLSNWFSPSSRHFPMHISLGFCLSYVWPSTYNVLPVCLT